MLNFRNTSLAALLVLVLLAAAHAWLGLDLIWPEIVVIAYLLLLVYGSSNIRSGFYMEVRCSADTKNRQVAITFDDGPSLQFTPAILAVLHQEEVQAAFFCIGKNVEGNEWLCRRIYGEGHIIGNHSYSHGFFFDLLSARKMSEDLSRMDQEVYKAVGICPRLFRPPYGVTNPNLAKAVRDRKYIPVGWNIRSMDTVASDSKSMLDRIMGDIRPGSVILLHDTRKITADSLAQLIRRIRGEGYQIVRIDKLLNLEPYA